MTRVVALSVRRRTLDVVLDDRRKVPRPELDPTLASSLRKIERRVLAEVPLRRRSVLVIWVAMLVLACMSIVTAFTGASTPLSALAEAFGVAAVVFSLVAVRLRRFGACWLAAATSAVGTPISILGYWSDQTAEHQTSLGLLVATVCHVVLLANWVQCVRPPAGHGSGHAP
ncbi:hypothetical protein LK459_07360 [Gordonia otitidis]|uniref:Rv2732c family membrane protein n=1 Tax=Gordonia otitidis TaxID=249058 RepID=UPI001D156B4F|nr:hypothetical protein [Gordonia otitidis]UEA60641.1 hypothetical protein LK459_07360 [Gordonia otitidis]